MASYFAVLLIINAAVYLFASVLAIPLALRGDTVALKHRTFGDPNEFAIVQRAWARWGALILLASLLLPAITIGVVTNMASHSPEGLNTRLLTASTHGNVAEINAVLTECRQTYGGYGNMDFQQAISNAQYAHSSEAVRLLQEEMTRQGSTQPTGGPMK